MRVTSANAFDNSMSLLQTRQRQLADAQERLTSGKRVARASDDPSAAARAERALASISRVDANQRALEASRAATIQTETALADAGELLQQVRETVVGAGNASYSDAERNILAVSLRGLRNQLLAVANRDDGAGGHLFGGQGSASIPFVDAPGGVQFAGATGTLRVATDEPLPLTVDGQSAWLRAPNAVSGGPDLSLFDVIDRVITELETPGRDTTTISLGVRDGLRDIDAVAGHLLGVRAHSGEALHLADSMEDRMSADKLGAQTEKSNAEDLDMVKAISDFQGQQTGYEAALKTYSIVQRMSLFDYLQA